MRTRQKIAHFAAAAALGCFVCAQSLAGAIPAKQGRFIGMTCFSGQMHVVTEDSDHVGISYDLIGTQIRNEGELGFLSSEHCVGSRTTVRGEATERGSCVSTDPDGDRVFLLYSGFVHDGGKGGFWRAVAGTGKYDGIVAQGTWVPTISPAKPVRADTLQECNKESGHWKLR